MSVMAVSYICLGVNLVLALVKLAAGLAAGYLSVISDGADSLADVLSAVIVIIAVRISSKVEDREHPFGHERFENIGSIILANIMTITCAFIARKAIVGGDAPADEGAAVAAAVSALSAVSMLLLSLGAGAAARKRSSLLLRDMSLNYREDVLTSSVALAGPAGEKLGIMWVDRAAGLIICFFMLRTVAEIYGDAVNGLVDRSADAETEEELREAAVSVEGVKSVDSLLTRMFGSRLYVEMEISADGTISLNKAHKIAHDVHDAIEEKDPRIKHCTVHVNPAD